MKSLLTPVVFMLSFSGFSQFCVRGIVKDKQTQLPVRHASVFLPELNILTQTDSLGSFTLCSEKQLTSLLQITAEGYEPFLNSITLDSAANLIEIGLSTTSRVYPEIIVVANRMSRPDETPNTIVSLSSDEMRDAGALSLSDGIAKIPGVSQLTTGVGISKPVIRGLYGNRIQTVMLGLRFDNQQWQDEHGLGLSDVGVDHVEIIKGAASLLYGSEAMGGVLNIIEEKPAPVGVISGDFSTRFFSNSFGNATDFGVKGTTAKINWRIRAGLDNHADYSDGNKKRVLNSRFGGYYLKGSVGFQRRRWDSQNDYMFSLNNFGFLMEASMANLHVDPRQSRSFDMPHHSVFLHVFSSQNTHYLKRSKLNWVLGAQVNDRQEQEGGNKISLNMVLQTYTGKVLWMKQLSKRSELSLGTEQLVQRNKNIGSRMIIPDADLYETSLFTYFKHARQFFSFEGGLRYSLKNISTYETGTINTAQDNPGSTILPFSKFYNSLNGSLGLALFDKKHWNVKTSISSGYRPGNLAELSSNGLHEGSVRYEIGNSDLKIEQNICMELFASYSTKWVTLSSSVYLNRFFNYIYLAPTNEEYIGFQIYRYIQENASLKGSESTLEIHPQKIKWLVAKASHSIVIGQTDQGNYLPFIPAQKFNSELKVHIGQIRKFISSFAKIGSDFVFAQNKPGQFETSSPSYFLWNAGIGTIIRSGKINYTISLAGTNLANAVYYDHLSRFKYFDIYNMGRNIVLNLKINF